VPKVLVVEDDADSADLLAVALRKPGYEIECVPDGRQALFAISEQRPDVIILDIRMPVMDGVTFMQVLRSYLRWKTLPVVIVTAADNEAEVDRAAKFDVVRVFRKANYKLSDLIETVSKLAPVQ
jgi:CheY-like chemotaxis protein